MSARFKAPDGVTVDVISVTMTSGPESPSSRDAYLGEWGDGQWIRVTAPGGILIGQVRTIGELAGLGVNLSELEEIR